MTNDSTLTTTIGILVVHGMGEQQKAEHLIAVAQSLVRAWQCMYGRSNVLELCSSRENEQESSCKQSGTGRTVTVLIKSDHGTNETKVELKEVYWADLDENPQGSWNQFRHQLTFWCWGLSLWNRKRKDIDPKRLPGSAKMFEPGPIGKRHIFLTRVRLFGVGVAFLFLGVTWELLRFIARRLRIVIGGSGVLVRYLGDVQLYTENRYRFRPAQAKSTDAPRDAIRRRMIDGLLEMSLKSYDRWYILAHSLGSVVAHNGLMELADALPNYLHCEQWERAQQKGLTRIGPETTDRKMRPARPPWLELGAAIDRTALFKNLKGFCTYGSPLDKFATIWPAVVPINCDTKPLAGCEWINVFDRMDPVGAKLDFFDKGECFKPKKNIAYKASWLFLLAHNSYLRAVSKDGFAARLSQWVMKGECFDSEKSKKFSGGNGRVAVRIVWWFVLSSLAASPYIWLANQISCCGIHNAFEFLISAVMDFICFLASIFSSKIDLIAVMCVLGIIFVPIALAFGIGAICGRRKP